MEHFPSPMTADDIRRRLGREPDLFLEIGSNDGTETANFAKAFPHADIVAFEPDYRAARAFREAIDASNVKLIEAAVSDANGETKLWMSGGEPKWKGREWDLSSSICRPTRHLKRSPEITFDKQVTVPTVTLDTWWAGDGKPTIDFIWCDPQGAQAKIIAGGQEALRHTRWLYIEYYEEALYEGEPNLEQIKSLLSGWGMVATYEAENALFRNTEF